MDEKLADYRQKRDFRHTPEPRGGGRRAGGPRFVVQRHAARRLHYDFRLELEGVLKSWAVPKGPSLDPADKRLAVHVEDHPLTYIDFEGIIPPKHYGAGEVRIWDQGRWQPRGDPVAGYRAGKLKFSLRGKKLNGDWTLVRTRLPGSGGKEQWLLIKERDDDARPVAEEHVTALPEAQGRAKKNPPGAGKGRRKTRSAKSKVRQKTTPLSPASLGGAKKAALPDTLRPQLATLVKSAPPGDDWQYELKFDGYRILARVNGKTVRLFTRNHHDWTRKLPGLARAVGELGLKQAWLDGEIVVPGKNGAPDFQALQNAFDSRRTDNLQYFLFDLPYLNGHDLRDVPLGERRALLQRLLGRHDNEVLRFSEDFPESPQHLLENACRLAFEGVIGKQRDAVYTSGRGRSWIKLKCTLRQEFVIGGYTDPAGSRSGFGALLLGVYDGADLRCVGRVGTGFNQSRLRAVHQRLKKLAVRRAPFKNPPREHGLHWTCPQLVAEVSFAQWTQGGGIRQAVFHGLRADKPARDIKREQPRKPPSAARTKIPPAGNTTVAGLRISHPDRVIDSRSGLTKIDLARYYEAVAPWMLPHLKARPVALLRAPDGIAGGHFFQKHDTHSSITGARLLDKKFDPGHAPLMVLDSVQALVGAAQMGAIEFHTWNGTVPALERPDRFVLDLDPDPALSWGRMVEAAELTKALLDELGLRSFLKTSGGKGLHIVVPLVRRHTWKEVLTFSQAVAQHLADTLPKLFSAKMGPKNRIKKVFVDYLRNRRGASTVSAYSARARPGLAVSVPVAWEALRQLEGPNQWDIITVLDRLGTGRHDVWKNHGKGQWLNARMQQALGLSRSKK